MVIEKNNNNRFWNVIYSKFRREVEMRIQEFRQEYQKLHGPDSSDEELDLLLASEKIRSEVLKSMKGMLGRRVSGVYTGGAATSPQVKQFLEECFGSDIVSEGYACSEAGQLAGDDGTVRSDVIFKLIDVPELGYFVT